ncbi:HIT/MYND zinc finger-like protein [Glarea lozoyensis ATCC 20868]|uniref:HIT/MYND zinc finger-like protein n=1 Tax=Glarea lozoyensis (strain ATCC 20868 / MF5171) TaxID=1116229 RepID=S3DJA7_GLAL2|nr:HIT/MYND zinc finger-like protein [Glarea lozoyensis ATCC 20868]EPE26638.1 HIT/MYND zinc finger-like protein [Glarea lozoyensis ATCC 20868]
MTFPNFTSPTPFPPFSTLPLISSPPTSSTVKPTYLLGTIQENMTLTPKTPTFICRDRENEPFAITLKLRDGQTGEGASVSEAKTGTNGENNFFEHAQGRKAFTKGKCVVIKNGKRKGSQEPNEAEGKKGKKGFVEGGWEGGEGGVEGGVCVIPTSLEKLMDLTIRLATEGGIRRCQGCGKVEEKMTRCKGCEEVWYCGKDCQVKGWTEGGHKSECKVLKAVKEIFGSEELGDDGFGR